MRHRITKVDEQTIAQTLGDMAVIALDYVSADCLIGAYQLA